MMRALKLSVVGIVLVLLNVGRADAGAIVWDWLERLSGPGPFSGSNLITTVCFHNPVVSGDSNRFLGTRADTKIKIPCLFVDYRQLFAPEDNGYPSVTAKWVDIGVTFQLDPLTEVGVGAGWVRFDADPEGQSKKTTHGVITIPRIVIRPLRLIPALKDSKWGGIFKPYLKYSLIVGDLKGKDFLAPDNGFHERNEWVKSYGVLLDLGELLR